MPGSTRVKRASTILPARTGRGKDLGIKTLSFRATFGEWRLNNPEPVKVIPQKGRDTDDRINIDTGWNINVEKQVFQETSFHKNASGQKAVPLLDYIDGIVKNAVLVDNCISNKKDGFQLSIILCMSMLMMEQKQILIRMLVEQMDDYIGNNLVRRSYKLNNAEVASNASKSFTGTSSIGNHTLNISDLFNDVKRIDKNFNPKNDFLLRLCFLQSARLHDIL